VPASWPASPARSTRCSASSSPGGRSCTSSRSGCCTSKATW